jgi:hypothetical protein
VAASQWWEALHAMLGPQSALLAHPVVQRSCGMAPPSQQAQGLPQMRPVPASAQSASLWQSPAAPVSHIPPQSGGSTLRLQKSPPPQSDCERHWPAPSPPVPPLPEELLLVPLEELLLVPVVVPVPPVPPLPPPPEDPHAAAARLRTEARAMEGKRKMRISPAYIASGRG